MVISVKDKKVDSKTLFPSADTSLEPIQTSTVGIPTPIKQQYERYSGLSLDDVRIHYNSSKPQAINALAYTQGRHVYIGPGQERHLRHELGHVLQQKQNRVKPTGYMNGQPVNTDKRFERESDNMLRLSSFSAGATNISDSPAADSFADSSLTHADSTMPIQGRFTVNNNVTVDQLSGQPLELMNRLRSDLQNTYGRIYDRQWIINLNMDNGASITPAYTRFVTPNIIDVFFYRWFLLKCTYGELLGMVNHELNVHFFADIAILSAESIANPVQHNYSDRGDQMKKRQKSRSKHARKIIEQNQKWIWNKALLANAAWTEKTNLPFTPGQMKNNSVISVVRAGAPPLDKNMGKEELLTYGETYYTGFGNGAGRLDLLMKSPFELRSHGAQLNHSYLTQANSSPGLNCFSPRFVVYAQMTIKLIDDFLEKNGVNPNTIDEITTMIDYYILDLARTWYESLDGTTINAIFLRNLMFTCGSGDVSRIATDFWNWLFDSATGTPNPDFNVTVSPKTAAVIKGVYPRINTTALGTEMLTQYRKALLAQLQHEPGSFAYSAITSAISFIPRKIISGIRKLIS